ncbi:hypothetical protein [Erythrobacter sp. JK5]|uniref:hypothetical protein n=1 Tax=Erythrobacter sp. JK5 TaxID=2829500 RepID=UPI001BA785B7|nr:hypothetical protein [Erythrobacter sp. JK5]QUL38421.1 hypothetical protein KDC96_03115 [Erythrobacter sp. JK5]
MIDPLLFGLFSGLIGLVVYVGIVFWAGRKRFWWLALFVTIPAMLAGLMSLTMDISQSSNPLFQNYGWLVTGQLIIGLVTYFVGRFSAKQASDQS